MQSYEIFWNQQLAPGGHRQLVIDWDIFIANFARAIFKQAHHNLNQVQRQYIKSKIDPSSINQIYKSAFLLFAKVYWDLPSNRTNLFKMKINLNHLPKMSFMTDSNPQRLFLTVKYKIQGKEGETKAVRREMREDRLFEIDQKGFEVSQGKMVKQKGFIGIGSGQCNDVYIGDCIYLNRYHLKLVSVKKELPLSKQSIFSSKPPKPQIVTQWYIRDIARSNRLKYQLDNPWKYVIVQPGMVINLGLTDEITIEILKVGFDGSCQSVSEGEVEVMETGLNQDRINFMGQIDKNVPIKTVVNIDFTEITSVEIQDLYQHGHYYPQVRPSIASKTKIDSKESPALTFKVINNRTFSEIVHVSNQNIFSIGRDKECTYQIDDICMRKKQVLFQFLNSRWTVRKAEKEEKSFRASFIGGPGVYLGSSSNIEEMRNSNRVRVKEGYPYALIGKQFDITVELKEPIKEEDLS